MRAWAACAVLLAAGCGAHIGGGNTGGDDQLDTPDAKVWRDAGPIDAPPDARPCMGGTLAQTAPDGSCLVFVSTPVTYVNAKAACTAMNAHLAYLKTSALDTFAMQLVGTTETWIGGDDRVTEMTWVWNDGTAFSFADWGEGEPNNGGNTYQEDCAIIAALRMPKAWDDRPCDASEVPASGNFAYLCQY